ncbi:hypothetical protein [Streptomyces avermitilis]|uniref:hypothetical protein n=1 Tax=Streptomyces avermitilis TaxID=33903 RepID=UPI0034054534
MRSGVQNFSSSVAGAVSSGVPLALGDALGEADGEAGGVVAVVLVEGDVDGVPGAVGVASFEGETDGDGPSGELLVGAVTGVGAESAHADVEIKVAAIAVAAARLCLSLKFPPWLRCSRAVVSGPVCCDLGPYPHPPSNVKAIP